jgi:protein tyrosine phosphatase (PTP) superfamily phosphohydrolase (DUF442 family)
MRSCVFVAALVAAFSLSGGSALAQQVTKENVPGIRNLARLETTVACAGAITPESVVEVKKMGFVSIVNLRLASEEGANVEKEEAAADPKAAEAFLSAITTRGAEPAFIHCAGGNRAATMWLIKRVAVDHWDVERATKEATLLGQTNPTMRQFAVDYAQAHKR